MNKEKRNNKEYNERWREANKEKTILITMNKIDKLFPKIEGDILKTNIVFGTPEITIYSLEDDREYYVCKDRKYLASVYEIKDVIIDQLDLTDEQISQIINTNHLIEIKNIITR